MKYSILFLFVLIQTALSAKTTRYETSLIPDSLLKNANVVIRLDSTVYSISGPGKAVLKKHKVLTVLNRHGDSYANVYVVYDRNSKVNSISGEILNANGERLRKIKRSEISDNSLVGNYTLFQDDRYLSFEALNHTYPYTIIFDYEISYDGMVSIDRWIPIPGYNVAVEKSKFTIESNNSVNINFKPINIESVCRKEILGKTTKYYWEMAGEKVYEKEPFSQSSINVFPVLWSVPDKFEYEGTNGDYTNWNSFGKWNWGLVDGKQDLPETTIKQIKSVISGVSDKKEKARLLYKYFQNKTRYVSVQMGIGGWEPFSASVVDEVGYGDCKALSNYMMSILKVAGINSIYSIIGNGKTKVKFPDFPCMGQTNHAILCVPFETDTVWLECTSQEYPFGYIGAGNSNRYVLLITGEGGQLVKTPYFDETINVQVRKAEMIIDNKGNAKGNVTTQFSGLQFSGRFFLLNENEEDQKKWLLKNLELNSPILKSFTYIINTTTSPSITETLNVDILECANISGKRLFLKPNLMNLFSSPPAKTDIRKFDIKQGMAYTDIDSINFIIPKEYIPESVFADSTIESEFGSYSVSLKIEDNVLKYIRRVTINDGIWPAAKYDEFRDFRKKVWKADKANVVFVRN
jgi:hypothetical protein